MASLERARAGRTFAVALVCSVLAGSAAYAARAHAAPAKHGARSVQKGWTATAMVDALQKVLRAVHAAHCVAPQSVEIRPSNRAWVVSLEWEQPVKTAEWSLDLDKDQVVRGACAGAR